MRYRGNQWMKAVISADIFFYQRPVQMRHGRGTNRIGNRYQGGFRSDPFAGKKLLTATLAGQEATVHFNGGALGAYVLAGPDAGVLEVSIDGGKWQRVDLYHRHSRGLHYPRTVMFATDLKTGAHTAKIRLSNKSNHLAKELQLAYCSLL